MNLSSHAPHARTSDQIDAAAYAVLGAEERWGVSEGGAGVWVVTISS
jgi:hypothetical protein